MTEPDIGRWQPLLDGERAAQARAVALEIADALERRPASPLHGLKGDASIALLLAHCERPAAAERLETALGIAAAEPSTISLFGGIAGASWVVHHVAAPDEAEPVLAQLDAALLRYLDVARWEDRVDLVSGLAGVGICVAERRDSRACQIANRVLSHLEAIAITGDGGMTWYTPPRFLGESRRNRFPRGSIDLGAAHGVPGILGMLARFVEADLEAERAYRVLESAVAWLLDTVPIDAPRFGTTWPPGDDERSKPLGWCHGDPGVAGALLHAGRALGSPRVEAEAIELLHRLPGPLLRRGVDDGGFCHGAAGIAHIYNLAFQRTGSALMRQHAEYWLTRTLRLRRSGAGIAGFASRRLAGGVPCWEADPTLISGATGIALVLLAATEHRAPAWQHLFGL